MTANTEPGYRIVVGYTADDSGADALALGARIAGATEASLEVVMVLPIEARGGVVPRDPGHERRVKEQAQAWLAEASAGLGGAVDQALHIRYADSFAGGLVAAAHEFGARLVVVGPARGGLFGRTRIGSVASELLHSADVPVALAPVGARKLPVAAGLTRVTAAVGGTPGVVLEASVALARRAHAPLRLLSLVPIDLPAGVDTGLVNLTSTVAAEQALEGARRELPAGVEASAVVATGQTIEESVGALDWEPGELVLVGSSRLAAPSRLFLGGTATKMLRELPVPLIVVPRAAQTS
ncbi:universal stress protein [Agromyces mediolanus]|uniref:Universal stress protein UspA n=1 Tax=Agromyces mediolanus TaxID=41986 RepID=A0A918CK46_AGRME|nr:universal stress protein [Agromyces mediolanus]GGR29436.1 universal stress protein UspA [Agromyces mediolanus]GLJ72216.1 universal stress protein UspA [Agromyces mediolanus]